MWLSHPFHKFGDNLFIETTKYVDTIALLCTNMACMQTGYIACLPSYVWHYIHAWHGMVCTLFDHVYTPGQTSTRSMTMHKVWSYCNISWLFFTVILHAHNSRKLLIIPNISVTVQHRSHRSVNALTPTDESRRTCTCLNIWNQCKQWLFSVCVRNNHH